MAIYHLGMQALSRSDGRSATGAAAYRAGARVVDQRTGVVHDFTRRGGLAHSELLLPSDVPTWAADRDALWNAAEAAETRKNSRVAREFIAALPCELSRVERRDLAVQFTKELVARHGVAADLALHDPSSRDGDDRNFHAHILISTRALGADGFGEKTREFDDQKEGPKLVEFWRARWETLANEALERAGSEARIDRRTLKAQRNEALARGDYAAAEALDRPPMTRLEWREAREAARLRAGGHVQNEMFREAAENRLAQEDQRTSIIDLAKIREKVREADEKANAHLRDGNAARLRQAALAVLPVAELESRIKALQPPTIEAIFNGLAPIQLARGNLKAADHDALLARAHADQARQSLAKASAEIEDWDRNRPIRKFLTAVGIFRDQTRENLTANRDRLLLQLQTLEQAKSAAEALQIAARTELAQIEADPALQQRAADMHAEKTAAAAPQIAELQKAIKARNAWAKVGKKYLTDSSEDSDQVSQNRPAPGSSNPHF